MVEMRKFDYRAPRFAVDLPVWAIFDEERQKGRCIEISTEGMKLEMRQPLSHDSHGRVQVTYLDVTLELPVRVAHSGASFDGVKFLFESDEQRDDLARLVSILSGVKQKLGPSLVR